MNTIPRKIDLLVVHCSATVATADIGAAVIRDWHKQRGFKDIGYHYVIRRDGKIEYGRPEQKVGAHVQGFNAHSIGICLVGGLAPGGKKAENNFTPAQFETLESLLAQLLERYPGSRICGHRDLSPDLNKDGKITPNEFMKQCPSFSVEEWLKSTNIKQ